MQIVVERLTKNVTEDHLREIFGTYGHVEDLDLPIGRSKSCPVSDTIKCPDGMLI
jgi:RNA recognition motif-containing protein